MNEYPRSTDETHEIQLTSSISNAVWGYTQASIGEEVPLEVRTNFVGDGSRIRISVHNGSGRRLDRFEGVVRGNRYNGTYTISDRAEDSIYFEAELRDHGLSARSDDMEIVPPVTITNLRWSAAEARRGDILELTADVEGVPDGTEATIEIYEHDEDEAHDFITSLSAMVENNRIETRWTYEYHEDTDEIPTQEESESGYNPPEYFFKVIIRGNEAVSELLEFKDWIEIELRDVEDNPIGGRNCTVYMPDGSERQETLDDNGYLRLEDIPPGPIRIEVETESSESESDESSVDA